MGARSGEGRIEERAHGERVRGSPEFVRELLDEADWERRQALQQAPMGLPEVAPAAWRLSRGFSKLSFAER